MAAARQPAGCWHSRQVPCVVQRGRRQRMPRRRAAAGRAVRRLSDSVSGCTHRPGALGPALLGRPTESSLATKSVVTIDYQEERSAQGRRIPGRYYPDTTTPSPQPAPRVLSL